MTFTFSSALVASALCIALETAAVAAIIAVELATLMVAAMRTLAEVMERLTSLTFTPATFASDVRMPVMVDSS